MHATVEDTDSLKQSLDTTELVPVARPCKNSNDFTAGALITFSEIFCHNVHQNVCTSIFENNFIALPT